MGRTLKYVHVGAELKEELEGGQEDSGECCGGKLVGDSNGSIRRSSTGTSSSGRT
jgi:hypothetical protein